VSEKKCLHKFRKLPDGSLECKLCGEVVHIEPLTSDEIAISRDKYSHPSRDRKIRKLLDLLTWWP